MKNFLVNAASIVFLSLIGLTASATGQCVAQDNEPTDFRNFMAFGNQAIEDHRWAMARTFFLLAHEQEPENATAVYRLAMTDLLENKDLGRARYMIEQVLPVASPEEALRLLDTQARIALREGRLADAQISLDLAQATVQVEDPDFPFLLQETDDSLVQLPQTPPL